MRPGDVYEMELSDKRTTRLLVEEIVDDDRVTVRHWLPKMCEWSKWALPMQKCNLSRGRRIPADVQ